MEIYVVRLLEYIKDNQRNGYVQTKHIQSIEFIVNGYEEAINIATLIEEYLIFEFNLNFKPKGNKPARYKIDIQKLNILDIYNINGFYNQFEALKKAQIDYKLAHEEITVKVEHDNGQLSTMITTGTALERKRTSEELKINNKLLEDTFSNMMSNFRKIS